MKLFNKTLLFGLVILASCAQIVAPTGGPKDEIGPKVLEVLPKDKTVKFSAINQDVRIRFDEFIQLKDPSKQIVMSPPLKEAPEYLINGKELRIKFKEPLANNTTYTINFGNAVIDNHEGIVANNLQYTFSTGNYIDSNFIKGKVKNAFTDLPAEGVIVSLYKKSQFTDTTINKFKPTYFTKTKADGTFTIENMPTDEFYLYAYKKEGIDLKYAKNDSVAISKLEVNTGSKNGFYNLFLFKPNEHKINKIFDTSSNQIGIYNLAVYKPKSFLVTLNNGKQIYQKTIKGNNSIDTIKAFVENGIEIPILKINALDTSFSIKITPKKKSKLPELNLNAKTDINPLDTFLVEASLPIKTFIKDSILFKEDTVVIKPQLFDYQNNTFKFRFHTNWKESTKYNIIFKDSALQDIYGNYNKSTTYNINIKQFKDYGNLVLNVELAGAKHNYILQLLNKNTNEVIREFNINKSTQLKLEYLNPVEAKIKVIKDLNNNGIWDNGDLEKMILPEKVFNYNQVFNIRAYWDLEQNVNINDIINQQ